MVAAGTYQMLSRGLLATIAAHCPAVALGSGSWGLWAAWRATEALACYVLSLGDALLGLAVLLAAPWLVYRSGLLRWAWQEQLAAVVRDSRLASHPPCAHAPPCS